MLERSQKYDRQKSHAQQHNGQTEVTAAPALSVIRNAPHDRPFVVAQLGQSLDGRIATVTGESRWINGDPALDHVHRIRANVDAVIIGVGTAIADDPLLTVRRVKGKPPVRVIIDPNNRLPPQARCLGHDGTRCIIVRDETSDKIEQSLHHANNEVLRIPAQSGHLPPDEIIKRLFELGLRRILVEGGSRTVSAFIDADAVDRLHILMAPMIIGSGKPGLELAPIKALSAARRPVTVTYSLGNGEVLFDCDLRSII